MQLRRALVITAVWLGVVSTLLHGQQAVTAPDRFTILKSGSLTVWGTDLPQFMNFGPVQAALAKDFPGLKVTYRALSRKDFLPALSDAMAAGPLPDAIFVDNWSVGGPMTARLPVVQMIGQPRFPSRGWWFAVDDAAHRGAGEAFLRWLEEPPTGWKPPESATTGMTADDKTQTIAVAMKTVLEMAGPTDLGSTMDKDANRFSPSFGSGCGHADSISDASVDFLFGNGRIAYAALSSETKAKGTATCIGLLHSFVVLRKREDGWKALLIIASTSLAQAEAHADGFERLGLLPSPAPVPEAPKLIAPYDGEQQTRFPKQEIAWAQSANAVAYVVEARAGNVNGESVDYGASGVTFVDPKQYGTVVRIPTPFGVGMQPHQWRVWAIGKDGTVALSEWRTVQFTN